MITHEQLLLSELKIEVIPATKDSPAEYYICVNGQEYKPSDRFWSSFGSKFLINRDMFRFFTPEEVLNRVIEQKGDAECQITTYNNQLFAIVDSKVSFMSLTDVESVFKYKTDIIGHNFIVDRKHSDFQLSIGNESFNHYSRFEIPIDGYGSPSAISGLLRLACLNGNVASTKLTDSIIKLGGEDQLANLARAVSTYNNDGGFEYIENRMEAAMSSTASLAEVLYCRKMVEDSIRKGSGKGVNEKHLLTFDKEVGNLHAKYGRSSFNSVSERKKSLVPTERTVFEINNLMTELSSHIATPEQNIKLHGAIHNLLGKKEFDLEGITKAKPKKFIGRYFA